MFSVFDPLDGSSNVDAGIPTGTIFGIFDESEDCEIIDGQEVKGTPQVDAPVGNKLAAGYVLYSSATSLFFTLGAARSASRTTSTSASSC